MNEITDFSAAAFSSLSKSSGRTFSQKRAVELYEIELFDADYHYTVIDGKKIPYRKNTVVIAKPGQVRNSKLHFRCRFLHLGLSDGLLKETFDALPSAVRISDAKEYLALFDEAAALFLESESILPIYAVLYRLAALLERDAALALPGGKSADGKSEALHSVTRFLERHYDRRITLSDLASQVSLHPVYLHRIFKRAYGKTPAEYLLSIRLSHAKYLLLNTDSRIGEVASLCGFDSQPYFSAVFSKETGQSPTAFRAKYKKPI